ncbi:hypothetical protein DYH09_04605 [bacterium CPR1]|nr:hypothetical protein [bacterium CPR1]
MALEEPEGAFYASSGTITKRQTELRRVRRATHPRPPDPRDPGAIRAGSGNGTRARLREEAAEALMTQKVQTFYEQAMQQLTPHERAELADLLADQEELDLYWHG